MTDDLVTGDDGRQRCWWCGTDPQYVAYHDEEWGVAEHDERRLFEKLCLEGFQAGLSWLTVLRRRQVLREAFAGFDHERLADWGEVEVAERLADPRMIRNRGKVEAVVANARALRGLHEAGESLDALVWSFAPADHRPPRGRADVPATTPQATEMARELKRRGFRFVGPTTAYAFQQAMGLVDDHLVGCWRRG